MTAVVLTGCNTRKTDNKTEPSGNTAQLELSAVEESKAMAEGEVNYLTTADFKRRVMDFEANPDKWVFEGKRPAVIDFYTEWCGPCKALMPTIEEIAIEYAEKIKVVKIDVDRNENLAVKYGIMSIPALLFFVNGKPEKSLIGVQSKEKIEKTIRKFL